MGCAGCWRSPRGVLTTTEFAPRWTCWWRRAERRREAHRQVPRGWNYHVKYQALTRPQAALEGGHTTCSRALQRGLGLGRLLAGGDALSGRAGVAVGAERWHRHRAREHDRGGRRRPSPPTSEGQLLSLSWRCSGGSRSRSSGRSRNFTVRTLEARVFNAGNKLAYRVTGLYLSPFRYSNATG